MKKAKFRISKWIMLAFAILTNGFIILYSCLDDVTTKKWNDAFTAVFTHLVNDITQKEVKTTPVERIETRISDDKYNHLPGYADDEIPLGSAKEIASFIYPEDATNKALTYTASPADLVALNQSNGLVSVVGLKTGECVITAKTSDGGFESKVNVKVVETVAPVAYEISLDSPNIAIGQTQTIKFDIDGGVLTHDELINFRYYDTRQLTFSSLDETVATVDKYGVIYPQAVGTTTIAVKNGTSYSKTVDVNIIGGTPAPSYTSLSISGSDVCYANDMLLDQSSKKNHYQLTPKDGETTLDPEVFIWESSNELLVKVDKHGVMRGFRKVVIDDETATITAISKLTGQTVSFLVTVKNQIPTVMNVYMDMGDKRIWDKREYTVSVGDIFPVKVMYNVKTQNNKIIVSSSNPELISVTNEGNSATVNVLKEGTCTLKVVSVINPELTFESKLTIVKAGAISSGDVESVGHILRKSVGHAAVFMVSQIFTYLTLYMFFYEKPWWFYSSISLGEGLLLAGVSELIQFFVPSRDGAWLDILIDFSGIAVGAALTFLGIFIVKKIIQKKRNKKAKVEN